MALPMRWSLGATGRWDVSLLGNAETVQPNFVLKRRKRKHENKDRAKKQLLVQVTVDKRLITVPADGQQGAAGATEQESELLPSKEAIAVMRIQYHRSRVNWNQKQETTKTSLTDSRMTHTSRG